jgi:hypothetical protein
MVWVGRLKPIEAQILSDKPPLPSSPKYSDFS